jgi:hypothetical protein
VVLLVTPGSIGLLVAAIILRALISGTAVGPSIIATIAAIAALLIWAGAASRAPRVTPLGQVSPLVWHIRWRVGISSCVGVPPFLFKAIFPMLGHVDDVRQAVDVGMLTLNLKPQIALQPCNKLMPKGRILLASCKVHISTKPIRICMHGVPWLLAAGCQPA